MVQRVVVTGGSGFIGSAFIRTQLADREVTNIDIGSYAADELRLEGSAVETIQMDVADERLSDLMSELSPEVIFHFAAETHVTRSEADPDLFYRSNVEGTRNLLDAAARAGAQLVVHISTDEVYGPALDRPFTEEDKRPGEGAATSAYAKSKAIADDLATSCQSVRVITVRPTNCFGPWQHPEKAIPRWATRALRGRPLPVWGDGMYVRDWMFVEDACDAITVIAQRGDAGDVFNIGPQGDVIPNIDIARTVARAATGTDDLVYLTDYDRPLHDRRYAVDSSRLRSLGWEVSVPLGPRLEQTVDWYRNHSEWWEPLTGPAEALYEDELARDVQ